MPQLHRGLARLTAHRTPSALGWSLPRWLTSGRGKLSGEVKDPSGPGQQSQAGPAAAITAEATGTPAGTSPEGATSSGNPKPRADLKVQQQPRPQEGEVSQQAERLQAHAASTSRQHSTPPQPTRPPPPAPVSEQPAAPTSTDKASAGLASQHAKPATFHGLQLRLGEEGNPLQVRPWLTDCYGARLLPAAVAPRM